jgi:hypothetical protein
MPPLDSTSVASLRLDPAETIVSYRQGEDKSVLVLTNRRFIVIVPRGWIAVDFERTAVFDLKIGPDESIINSWVSAPSLPIVLTTQRLIVLTIDGGGTGTLISRNLETIAEPTVETWEVADGHGKGYSMHAAGRTIAFYNSSVYAVKDEIAHTRNRRLRQIHPLLGSDSSSPAAVSVQREREIIREIVRTPCSHCGILIDNTALKCPSCGAPRT